MYLYIYINIIDPNSGMLDPNAAAQAAAQAVAALNAQVVSILMVNLVKSEKLRKRYKTLTN
jgi:hypothetical protein